MLRKYEEKLDLSERKEMIKTMLSSSSNLPFLANLQGEQLVNVNNTLKEIGEITDDDIKPLISHDRLELFKFLNFTSAKFIKRLSEPKYEELTDIIFTKDLNEAVRQLNQYLSMMRIFKNFLRYFLLLQQQIFPLTGWASQNNTLIWLLWMRLVSVILR